MIREVSGDILFTQAHAMAHGVAPNDNFAHGLALALRERWPVMYKDFRSHCHQFHPKPGELWTWGGVGGVRIVNLMTQEGAYELGSRPGKASIENVNQCMRELKKEVIHRGFTSLAMPRLATGVGGLEWEVVRPVVYKHLKELHIPIVIYVNYQHGQRAEEKLPQFSA